MMTDWVSYLVYFLYPEYYPSVFWFCFTFWLMAEFAVLAESSDHIFKPYPPIRRLGRFLTVCFCLIFFVIYIAPPLLHPQSPGLAMLDLVMRSSLIKAVLIVVLFGAARLYQLPLGKNVSGMMLGFAAYMAMNITNMALDERYASAGYAGIFAVIGPVGFILALAIWNVALWQYEPVSPDGRGLARSAGNIAEPLSNRLERYDSELTRFFRR